MPENLEESAARTGALVRKRGIRDAEALLRILLAYGCTDFSLQSLAAWANEGGLVIEQGKAWLPARVVAARTRKGDVIWVLTTVPKRIATDVQIMDSYRLRWQIELQFKRFKSLLDLDILPTRSGPTARSWILARLLAAALIQELNAS